jgi:hypothetical protein
MGQNSFSRKSAMHVQNNGFQVNRQYLMRKLVKTMVARCFIFSQKIPIWEYFGGPWNGKCCYIFWLFGIFYAPLGRFYGHLEIV